MSGKFKNLPVEYVKRDPKRPGSDRRMIVVPGEGVMSMGEYTNQLIESGKIKNLPGKIVRVLNSKGGGLREWVKQNWVDIANKKSDGSYPKCG